MTEIVGIRFKNNGKTYYFAPNGLKLEVGDHAVVETSRGVELGECSLENREIDDDKVTQPLRTVIKVATEDDLLIQKRNEEKAKEALAICHEKVKKHGLNMRLIDAEYTFDGAKVTFYFLSDNRVDFRELVKDLAATFKVRIELRQVGVRDKAKTVGGIGVCGRIICCASDAAEFQPVTIKMAKEQGLSLSPSKISGVCGRLMCCLKYEEEAYEDAIKRMPGVGSLVKTPRGKGIVTEINLLKETVKVNLDNDDTEEAYSFKLEELEILKKESRRNAQTMQMGDEGDINALVD